jgi:hypothetical protein
VNGQPPAISFSALQFCENFLSNIVRDIRNPILKRGYPLPQALAWQDVNRKPTGNASAPLGCGANSDH